MRRVHALCADVSEDFDVSASVEIEFATGPVRNDPAVTAAVFAAVQRALPEVALQEMASPIPASDDMSVILEAVPGCYMMVGAAPPDGSGGMHHSPTFAIDEAAVSIGANVLATSAVALAAGVTA